MVRRESQSPYLTNQQRKDTLVTMLSGPVPMVSTFSLGKYIRLTLQKGHLEKADMGKEFAATKEEEIIAREFRPALLELLNGGSIRYLRLTYRRKPRRMTSPEVFNENIDKGVYFFLSERIDDVLQYINESLRKPVPREVVRMLRTSLSEHGLDADEASMIGRETAARAPIPENRLHALKSGSLENYVIVAYNDGLTAYDMLTEIKSMPDVFSKLSRNFSTRTDSDLKQALSHIASMVVPQK